MRSGAPGERERTVSLPWRKSIKSFLKTNKNLAKGKWTTVELKIFGSCLSAVSYLEVDVINFDSLVSTYSLFTRENRQNNLSFTRTDAIGVKMAAPAGFEPATK